MEILNMNSIQAAMDQAKVAAANAVVGAAQANVPAATSAPSSTALAPVAAQRLNLADIATTARTKVDHYLKVDKYGMTVGKSPQNPLDEIKVTLNVSEASFFWSLRVDQVYKRSNDRVSEDATGQPWPVVVAQGQRADPKCKGDYKAAEIPMTLAQDVTDKAGNVIAKAGDMIGYTTSITGFEPFQQLVAAAFKTGNDNVTLSGTLKHKYMSRDRNEWGVIQFENFEPVILPEVAGAVN
jgi:hypothetical protein